MTTSAASSLDQRRRIRLVELVELIDRPASARRPDDQERILELAEQLALDPADLQQIEQDRADAAQLRALNRRIAELQRTHSAASAAAGKRLAEIERQIAALEEERRGISTDAQQAVLASAERERLGLLRKLFRPTDDRRLTREPKNRDSFPDGNGLPS